MFFSFTWSLFLSMSLIFILSIFPYVCVFVYSLCVSIYHIQYSYYMCSSLLCISSPSQPTPPPTFQVYSRRFCPTSPNRLNHMQCPILHLLRIYQLSFHFQLASVRNPSPHYTTLIYRRLSPSFYTCLFSICTVSIPKTVGNALAQSSWHQAMFDKINALQSSGT